MTECLGSDSDVARRRQLNRRNSMSNAPQMIRSFYAHLDANGGDFSALSQHIVGQRPPQPLRVVRMALKRGAAATSGGSLSQTLFEVMLPPSV